MAWRMGHGAWGMAHGPGRIMEDSQLLPNAQCDDAQCDDALFPAEVPVFPLPLSPLILQGE